MIVSREIRIKYHSTTIKTLCPVGKSQDISVEKTDFVTPLGQYKTVTEKMGELAFLAEWGRSKGLAENHKEWMEDFWLGKRTGIQKGHGSQMGRRWLWLQVKAPFWKQQDGSG